MRTGIARTKRTVYIDPSRPTIFISLRVQRDIKIVEKLNNVHFT